MARLALVEKFVSLQGEGGNVGRHTLFIRFAGCNLDCVFADGSICDTPWRKAQEKIELEDLVDWVRENYHVDKGRYFADVDTHPGRDPWRSISQASTMVCLTGGEPTMAPQFDDLVNALKFPPASVGEPCYVAVESNGTIWRDSLSHVDWLVVSPKTDIEHDKPLASPNPSQRVLDLPPHEYRYVISGIDSPAPPVLPAKTHFLSPALESDGTGLEWQMDVVPNFVPGAVERCLEIIKEDPRWRLSLQTHKWLRIR